MTDWVTVPVAELIRSWRRLRDRLVPEDQMTAELAYDECIADLGRYAAAPKPDDEHAKRVHSLRGKYRDQLPPSDHRPDDELARLRHLAIESYQDGYARGYDSAIGGEEYTVTEWLRYKHPEWVRVKESE